MANENQDGQTIQADSTEELMDILSADESPVASTTPEQAGSKSQSTDGGTSAKDSTVANQPPAQQAKDDSKTAAEPAPDGDKLQRNIESALGLKAKEPETIESLKMQLAASSRDGIENARKVKGLEEVLSRQGLKPVITTDPATGKPVIQLTADSKYVAAKFDELKLDARKLTRAEEQAAMDDPAAFAQKIWAEAVRKGIEIATKSPVPTVDDRDVVLPAEMLKLYSEQVKHEKTSDGKPVRPDYDSLAPYIDRVVDMLPDRMRELMGRDADSYKAVLDMVYGKVAHIAAPLIARANDAARKAAQRQEQAKEDVSLAVEGGQKATQRGSGSAIDDERNEIVNAQPLF